MIILKTNLYISLTFGVNFVVNVILLNLITAFQSLKYLDIKIFPIANKSCFSMYMIMITYFYKTPFSRLLPSRTNALYLGWKFQGVSEETSLAVLIRLSRFEQFTRKTKKFYINFSEHFLQKLFALFLYDKYSFFLVSL